ncbi:hypothetical protein ACYTYC_09365, partial [Streptococcus pyogenes]
KQALHELESSQNQSSKQEAQDRLLKQEVSLSENSANLVLSQEKLAALQARLAELSSAIAETKEGIARFSEDPDQVIESLRESYVRLMQTE